ncbi:hypothetical protein CEXT_502971 [Caerostris extrusa]|uniref:Uncharacterized protein n=1 Tax=Caerostris extrusa TaxID=172846 RepID=A0AAV4RY31_CAEEX|nr:hypothetical protein CEXT_502971 [Caerostris extrusa]
MSTLAIKYENPLINVNSCRVLYVTEQHHATLFRDHPVTAVGNHKLSRAAFFHLFFQTAKDSQLLRSNDVLSETINLNNFCQDDTLLQDVTQYFYQAINCKNEDINQ